MSDDVKERVASAIADALGPDSFDCSRVWSAWSYGTMGPGDFIETHQRADEIADAALSALRPGDRLPAGVVVPEEPTRKFGMGDRVTKLKGSSWTGRVVGFYSASLTPVGYAIESENEPGSVQVYPEAALGPAKEPTNV